MSYDFSGKHTHFESLAPEATGLVFTTDPEKGGYKVKERARSRKCKVLAITLLTAASTLYLQTRYRHLKPISGPIDLDLPGSPLSSPELPMYKLHSNIANNLGPYAARYVVPSNKTDLPPECDVEMINILQRHGARYPTIGAGKKLRNTLTKLQSVQHITDRSLEFVPSFKFDFKDEQMEQLVDFGRLQLHTSGRIIAQNYSALGGEISVHALNDKDRVKESSLWWERGFRGEPFDPENHKPPQTKDTTKHEEEHPNDPKYGEAWLEKFAPPVTKRLNDALGVSLTDKETLILMNLCGYQTAAENGKPSPWCNVFTDKEWESHEYYYDLKKYYEHSYGSKIKRDIKWVRDLKARLTGGPVEKNDPKKFTIGPDAHSRIFADFYSDNNIMEIITAMGILRGDGNLPEEGPIPSAQQMVVSKVVPFAGCMVVEKISCKPGSHYVRILINDAVVPLSCGDGYGMCALDEFIKSLSPVEQSSGRGSK